MAGKNSGKLNRFWYLLKMRDRRSCGENKLTDTHIWHLIALLSCYGWHDDNCSTSSSQWETFICNDVSVHLTVSPVFTCFYLCLGGNIFISSAAKCSTCCVFVGFGALQEVYDTSGETEPYSKCDHCQTHIPSSALIFVYCCSDPGH